MGKWRNCNIHINTAFTLYLLSLLLPSSWTCRQDSVDPRSKIRDTRRCRYSCSSEGDKVFTVEDKFGDGADLFTKHIFRIEMLLFVFLFFMGCMGHETIDERQLIIWFNKRIWWFLMSKYQFYIWLFLFIMHTSLNSFPRIFIYHPPTNK